MNKIIGFFRASLPFRLGLWITLFAALIFIGSLRYLFVVSREAVSQEAVNHATQILDNTVYRINAILNRVEVATDNTDWHVLRHLDAPDSMATYSRHILKDNPDFYGCSIAFEPYYFKEKGEYFSIYTFNDKDSLETTQEGNTQYHYFCMDWYLLPKLLDRPCWTEPYIDLDPDTTYVKEMIISYGKPLKNKAGNFVGVISTDLSLSWLSQVISAVKPYPNSYSIMMGRGGTYLVHPDTTKLFYQTIFTKTLQRPDTAIIALGHAMQAGEEGMRRLSVDGKDCYVFYKPLGSVDWSVAIICPESDIFSGFNRLRHTVLTLVFIGLLLMLYIFYRVVTKEMKPLQMLAREAETIATGQFDVALPDTKRVDEIGKLTKSFGHMQRSLVAYIEELKTTTAQKASIESELNVAKDIQLSMLPKQFPPFPDRTDIDVYGELTSAKEVGGDLFDFYIRDEKLFFCIGDVSGKGVPASLLMTVTRSLFRTLSTHYDEPDKIVMAMNDQMAIGNTSHMFVTLFLGSLDLQTGKLVYCSGGHNPPLLINDDVETLAVVPTLPVGIMKGRKYVANEKVFTKPTMLFLYTDGLTEAENDGHELFGEDRMKETARDFLHDDEQTPKALITRMTEAVHDFVNDAPQSDDLTMLAITYKNQQ